MADAPLMKTGPGWHDGMCDSGQLVSKADSSVYPPGKFGPVPETLPVVPCDRRPFTCPHRYPNTCRSNPANCPSLAKEKP